MKRGHTLLLGDRLHGNRLHSNGGGDERIGKKIRVRNKIYCKRAVLEGNMG